MKTNNLKKNSMTNRNFSDTAATSMEPGTGKDDLMNAWRTRHRKANAKALMGAFLAAAMMGSSIASFAAVEVTEADTIPSASAIAVTGAAGAAADSDRTLSDMLTYAIQDEYLARAEYAAILARYGSINPFFNIIKAEDTHIRMLLPLFEANNLTVPINDAAGRIVLPETLMETYAIGVEAERMNIAMYDSFLKEDLPADVSAVFTRLRDASLKHLKAFENAVSRDGLTSGTANGTGRGNERANGRGASQQRGRGNSVPR